MLFSLGFLVAALGALAIAPAFWSRAIRLATRKLELQLPHSASEVLAGRDLVRAELAVAQRKLEQKVEALGAIHARDMAEIGRRAVIVAEKDSELERLHERLAARDAENADLRRFLAEATDALDATTAALHDANGRCDRSEADLQNVRREREAMQKLCADQAETLAELERKLVHTHDSQVADEPPDLRQEHDAALARLRAATAGIGAEGGRIPVPETHDAGRRAGPDTQKRASIAADESLRRAIDRLVADLESYRDAADSAAAAHPRDRGSGPAPTDEAAILRKRISEVGAMAVRLAGAGPINAPDRPESEQSPPVAATESET